MEDRAMPPISAESAGRTWLAVSLGWSLVWMTIQAWALVADFTSRTNRLPGADEFRHSVFDSPTVLGELAWFAAGVAALHATFAVINWDAFRALCVRRLPNARAKTLVLLMQLLMATLALHIVNAWYFGNSLSGDWLSLILLNPVSATASAVVVATTAGYFALWLLVRLKASRYLSVTVAAIAIVFLVASAQSGSWHPDRNVGEKPNVIVIGVDSLRPDHLAAFGAPMNITPSIDNWLQSATLFSDALTPQAHTFPATVSILTGQHPHRHGARGNLFPDELIDHTASIAHDFSAAGYTTLYATDETRFANIDEQFGFNEFAGTAIGVTDFLMSGIADNVLTNLSSNTTIGRWLFPYIYSNRALDYSYRSTAFTRSVNNAVNAAASRDQPLFMFAHLCVGHWPYRVTSLYQDDSFDSLLKGRFSDANPSYLRAISEADQQFNSIMKNLEARGLLENTVVVLMSDHGEDFNMRKDVLSDHDGQSPYSYYFGHGGSAIRGAQVDVLLAMRYYGKRPSTPWRSEAPANLIDIAPSILELAGIPAEQDRFDGVSLASQVIGGNVEFNSDRFRFVESSYFPRSLNTATVSEKEVLAEMASMYVLSDGNRIRVRDDSVGYQIDRRQRAAYRGDWIVATQPPTGHSFILVNRTRKQWWDISEAPEESEAMDLVRALCNHWKMDEVIAQSCQKAIYQ